MKKIDEYKTRIEMVDMHNTYINNLKKSFNNKNYIETSWICYSIFEQRVNRIIEKIIEYCSKKIKEKEREKYWKFSKDLYTHNIFSDKTIQSIQDDYIWNKKMIKINARKKMITKLEYNHLFNYNNLIYYFVGVSFNS